LKPVLIDFGWFQLRSYGLFVSLGIIVAFLVALSAAKRRKINEDDMYNLGFFILIPAVIGARLAYVFSEWSYYAANPGEILAIWHGGLASYGGIFGGILGGIFYASYKKLDFLNLADAVALGLPVGFAIGRIGCFFNGCCYGIACNSPISFVFPAIGDDVPHLATQLIESAYSLLIFGFLLYLDKRAVQNGVLFFSFLGLYGFFRFLNEFLRLNPKVFLGFSGSQLSSLALILVSLAYFFGQKLTKKKIGNVGKTRRS